MCAKTENCNYTVTIGSRGFEWDFDLFDVCNDDCNDGYLQCLYKLGAFDWYSIHPSGLKNMYKQIE